MTTPNSSTSKCSKNERLENLVKLLATGSYTKIEIMEELDYIYNQFALRTFERDIDELVAQGYKIKVERDAGSRYVSFRLEEAPPRSEPKPDPASIAARQARLALEAQIAQRWQTISSLVNPEEVFSTEEVAALLGVTPRQVRFYTQNGQLKFKKLADRTAVYGHELIAFVNKGKPSLGRPSTSKLSQAKLKKSQPKSQQIQSQVTNKGDPT